jgi:dihydroorotase
MVVDNIESLEGIFRERKAFIAIHSENDHIIATNLNLKHYGDDIIPVKSIQNPSISWGLL